MRAGIENAARAASMAQRAATIEARAAHAIYSDDPDAIDRLRERIAELEAERDRVKAYNAACRRAGRSTPEALALLDDRQRADLESIARYASYQLGPAGSFPAYALSNLAGNIKRQRDRLAALERLAGPAEDAVPELARPGDAECDPDTTRRAVADHRERCELLGPAPQAPYERCPLRPAHIRAAVDAGPFVVVAEIVPAPTEGPEQLAWIDMLEAS
jgi:hypothetical protein